MKNVEKMKYTIAHRKAFRKIEKSLLGHNTLRSLLHDLDKLILYPFCDKEKFLNGIEIIQGIMLNKLALAAIFSKWLLTGNVLGIQNRINR